jgi:integrase/recombinase XerD
MARKANENKLTIYRRHASTCTLPATKLDGCDCPIWVHGRLRGKFIRESLQTRSLAAALHIRSRKLAGGDDPAPPTPGTTRDVNAPIDIEAAGREFIATKARRSRTCRYLNTLTVNGFGDWARRIDLVLLPDVNEPHVREYLCDYAKTHAISSTQGELRRLRAFFTYARLRRWITWSPAEGRDLNYDAAPADRMPFTPTEVTQVLAYVETMPVKSEARRDWYRAIILLMLYTGMRISDAVFFERGYVTASSCADYYAIKTRERIKLPPELQKPVLDALSKLPPSRVYYFVPDRDDDYAEARRALRTGQNFAESMTDFLDIVRRAQQSISHIVRSAGLTGACHRFRDTFAINMLVAGVDIFRVSQFLGHSSVQTTQDYYVKLVPGYQEKMSTATRALSYVLPQAAAA